jgi:DinB superfamily
MQQTLILNNTTMTRSQLYPLPEYFDRYITLNDDVTLAEALQTSLQELENAPIEKWQQLGHAVYAPGKWTVKDMLQHLTDTERVFVYRATAFARGQKEVLPFDEELFAKNANASARTLEHIIEEAIAVRKATIYLYQSFTADMINAIGNGVKGEYSVHAIGYIIAGHQRWHVKILEERYYPLLEK